MGTPGWLTRNIPSLAKPRLSVRGGAQVGVYGAQTSRQQSGAGMPTGFRGRQEGPEFTHRSDLRSCKSQNQMYNLGTSPNSFSEEVNLPHKQPHRE